jgi:serine/threonine protein kinase
MTTSRWSRVDAVFSGALELPRSERASYVERACAGDADLRDEVEGLLRAADSADTLIERLAPAVDLGRLEREREREATLSEGHEIGAYRIVALLGEGGMGAVYLAERADGQFEHRVAIKLVQPSRVRGGELVHRFVRERQILARLEHPNIARLYDGGVTADGQPFLVMEYVQGRPITEYCSSNPLVTDERVRLFQSVGRAVQYAHRNLVIHRDLKPSNILVTEEGDVKLLDFGIATLLGDEGDEVGPRTASPMMTPAYAAPEQVSGAAVTTATDVFALGVLLFELLTGHRPGAEPGVRPAGGDLDLVSAMALQERPEHRYASAEALVADLQRYLDGYPVAARPDSVRYRVGRFVTRHRGGVAAAALVVVSLIAGLGAALWQAGIARQEAATAREVSDFVLGLFEVSDPDEALATGELSVRDLLHRGAERIEDDLAGQPEIQAEMYGVVGPIFRRLGLYADARPLLERSADLQRAESGPASAAHAAAVHELGRLETASGELERADSLFLAAIGWYEETGGRDGLGIGRVVGDRALLARTANRNELADSLFLEARTALEAGGAPAEEVLALDLAHAETLHILGKSASADSIYARVIERREELPADRSLALAQTFLMSGQRYAFEGDHQRAFPLIRDAVELRRTALGDSHHDLAMALTALAAIMWDRDERDEALQLRIDAVEMLRETVGPEHPDYAMTLGSLGVMLVWNGELEEAVAAFRETERAQEETLGEEHFHLAMTRRNLGRSLMSLERYSEALPKFEAAITGWIAAQGDQDFFTGPTRLDLARVYASLGRTAAADSVVEVLLARYRETPPRGGTLGDALQLKARLTAGYGDLEGAVSLALEAIDVYEEQGLTLDQVRSMDSGQAIQRARVEVALGEFLMDMDRHVDAEPRLLAGFRAIEIGRGPLSPDAVEARALLARLYAELGRPDEAAKFAPGG